MYLKKIYYRVSHFTRKIKMYLQEGVNCCSISNLSYFLSKRLARYLKTFSKYTASYPPTTVDGRTMTVAEWKMILGKMIRSFELLVVQDDIGEDLNPEERKEIADGLILFATYFTQLWF